MSNFRIYAALAVVGMFAWWWFTRGEAGAPVSEELTFTGEPKSEAGRRVERVRVEAQGAADANAAKMKAAEEAAEE